MEGVTGSNCPSVVMLNLTCLIVFSIGFLCSHILLEWTGRVVMDMSRLLLVLLREWIHTWDASIFISFAGIVYYMANARDNFFASNALCYFTVSIFLRDSQLPFLTLLFRLGAMHIMPPLALIGEKLIKSRTLSAWSYTLLKLWDGNITCWLPYFAGISYLYNCCCIVSFSTGSLGRFTSSVCDWNWIEVLFCLCVIVTGLRTYEGGEVGL